MTVSREGEIFGVERGAEEKRMMRGAHVPSPNHPMIADL